MFRTSLRCAEVAGDPVAGAAALNNLGLVLTESGEVERGVDQFEASLQLLDRLGDRHHQAAVHSNLADALHALGRRNEAVEHAQTIRCAVRRGWRPANGWSLRDLVPHRLVTSMQRIGRLRSRARRIGRSAASASRPACSATSTDRRLHVQAPPCASVGTPPHGRVHRCRYERLPRGPSASFWRVVRCAVGPRVGAASGRLDGYLPPSTGARRRGQLRGR